MERLGQALAFLPFPFRVKGGEGWVKGHCLPFTLANALFMGVSGQKVKGEGFSSQISFRLAGSRIRVQS